MEKAYYVEFGDVISFDVTFHTNKYQMFFVPITAIGHHKKISYCWSEISDYLFTNKNFRKRFTKLVWDINMKPNVFEVTWGSLMKEFNLEYMRWFKDMFTKRDSWIPGYFNDIPMCRLVKTTSRLESMNSFFNTYSESGNLLLNFMMNYDTAIQKQRNTQREIDKTSNKASYRIQTPQEIEHKHQKFIQMGGKFTLCNTTLVKVNLKMNLRHAFTIMMRCGVKEIPERDDKKKLALFAEKQQSLLKEFESDYTSSGLKSKKDCEVVCKLMGASIPILEEINIHVPQVLSNKGFGIKERISSAGEAAYENSKKEHRMCSGCGKRVPHNLRTRPVRIAAVQSTKDI
ncbi:uncharacterized protein LOC111904920 [Lactuca sativa]|uniref:uncharacterized protein LOC111904920 n=1 Tax=Lactuca sativa TaxID=4236 RepID=UPI000CD9C481|nr:uncharacterized protein LOC111904920 [Lactuca sativa]